MPVPFAGGGIAQVFKPGGKVASQAYKLHAHPGEIIFSGRTHSSNSALVR